MQTYGGKTVPIVSGEWGYSTSIPISAQTQGDYLARSFLVNLSQGIPLSIWFEWKDDGTDPAIWEDNYGIVTAALVPKPAYNEMQLLTHSLAGETFYRKLTNSHSDVWLLEFTGPGGLDTLAAWSTRSGGRTVTVSGWGTLAFTSTPFYVNPTLEPGDASLDGTVNFTDLNIVLTNYNQAGGWMQGDFNHDGVVNFADLNIVLTNYNQSFAGATIASGSYDLDAAAIRALSLAGVTVVPEPAAVALLASGGLLLGGLPFQERGQSHENSTDGVGIVVTVGHRRPARFSSGCLRQAPWTVSVWARPTSTAPPAHPPDSI